MDCKAPVSKQLLRALIVLGDRRLASQPDRRGRVAEGRIAGRAHRHLLRNGALRG